MLKELGNLPVIIINKNKSNILTEHMDFQISKDALIATLEDYGTEELMEIALRNGLALPQRCSC